MGPLQLFLLGFEDFTASGEVAGELLKLSDAGTIRIIDARILHREADGDLAAARMSDLDDAERADLRASAGALFGLGAGAVLGGDEGAAIGLAVGAEATLDMGEIGLTAAEVAELAAELQPGDAVLVLLIENVWAEGFATALRNAGVTAAQQDYITPEGLVELGAIFGAELAVEG